MHQAHLIDWLNYTCMLLDSECAFVGSIKSLTIMLAGFGPYYYAKGFELKSWARNVPSMKEHRFGVGTLLLRLNKLFCVHTTLSGPKYLHLNICTPISHY